MTPEYQFYHGAFLHELIVGAGCEIRVALRNFHGRPDAYVINGEIGVLIKHSGARLTPWHFTFGKEHIAELRTLSNEAKICFVVFVCGDDGFVCVRASDFSEIIVPTDAEIVSVRVDRRPRKMYRVSSSGNSLDRKVAKGVHEILAEIVQEKSPAQALAMPA